MYSAELGYSERNVGDWFITTKLTVAVFGFKYCNKPFRGYSFILEPT